MRVILTFLLVLVSGITAAQRTRALEQLAYMMEGSYTSAEQARADTNYFEIELEMVRLWPKRRDGAWLYVEQAAVESKDKPYRQRVYHVQQVNDSTFTSTIYAVKGGARWFGAYRDPVLLASLPQDSLEILEGCTMDLERRGAAFVGGTRGRACANSRNGAAYATSEVWLYADRMVSWDRGWDSVGRQVWGALNGGYVFIKRR